MSRSTFITFQDAVFDACDDEQHIDELQDSVASLVDTPEVWDDKQGLIEDDPARTLWRLVTSPLDGYIYQPVQDGSWYPESGKVSWHRMVVHQAHYRTRRRYDQQLVRVWSDIPSWIVNALPDKKLGPYRSSLLTCLALRGLRMPPSAIQRGQTQGFASKGDRRFECSMRFTRDELDVIKHWGASAGMQSMRSIIRTLLLAGMGCPEEAAAGCLAAPRAWVGTDRQFDMRHIITFQYDSGMHPKHQSRDMMINRCRAEYDFSKLEGLRVLSDIYELDELGVSLPAADATDDKLMREPLEDDLQRLHALRSSA